MRQITIELIDGDYEALEKFALEKLEKYPIVNNTKPPVQRVLEYAAQSLAAGVRRPGSWEAAAVAALFGE